MENNSICLLDIEGVDHTLPANPKNFKQLQVKSIMEFPPFMAAIKRLTRVNSSVRIDSTNIIDTPRSVSYEGQVTTGLALTIGGWIDYSVEFLTDDISESLCTLNTSVPFTSYIVLDNTFNEDSEIRVAAYIEDIFVKEIHEKKLYTCTTLLLNALTLKIYE